MSPHKIVVGYDGSPEAQQAAQWALAEADRTGAAVELVYAWTWPSYMPAASMVPGTSVWPDAEAEATISRMMSDAVAAARRDHPDRTVASVIVHGPAALVLRDRAEHAALLVVGGRSHGAIAGVLLGSVSSAVAAHAPCSVVVCRGGEQTSDTRPVVVGLDDSARTGQLVVVTARGRGGFHGLRLGSVSRHLLQHSPCTVAVLRDSQEES